MRTCWSLWGDTRRPKSPIGHTRGAGSVFQESCGKKENISFWARERNARKRRPSVVSVTCLSCGSSLSSTSYKSNWI